MRTNQSPKSLFRHLVRRPIHLALTLAFLLPSIQAHAVIGGGPANEKRFEAVGALKIGSEKSVSCTATLIAAKWIVTADHCVHATTGSEEEGGGDLLPASEYEFRLGNDFKKPVFKAKLKRWVSGPKLNASDDDPLDIAFGELETAVPIANLKIDVIKPLTSTWNAEDMAAQYIHIGYGTIEVFSMKKFPLTDKRQQAPLTVTSTGGNALLNLFGSKQNLESFIEKYMPQVLESDDPGAMIANSEIIPGYGVLAWDPRGRTDLLNVQEPKNGWQDTCFGDSGGPLLRVAGNKVFIVGVVSVGMNRICAPLGTRFTTFGVKVRDLIKQLGI